MVSCRLPLDGEGNSGIKCGNLVVKMNKKGTPDDVMKLRVYRI